MPPASEHPDTREFTADVTLARMAIAFVLLTIGAPVIGALLS